ncbi:uncharacterized protein SAMN02745687_01391 [Lachnospiraceae bacterium NK3A20]|jgi:uncharacterized protein|nr:uncharacterized protein SAMN02745687_01391 [Lachnospiraceae bacterium NK3A20]
MWMKNGMEESISYMGDYNKVDSILSVFYSDCKVREMKKYIQHGRVSTYEHCRNVARLSYDINRLLFLRSDLNVLLTGAMLHDFYLYDWHRDDNGSHRLHGFTHAETARRNAEKYFHIDDKTSQVIYCHMWPLNLRRIPTSREAWIVCIADKCVSFHETLFQRKN